MPSWILEQLPLPLLRQGPWGILWWQWIAVPCALLAAWVVGHTLGWVTYGLLRRAAARTRVLWDDRILDRLRGPITLGWTLAAAYLIIPGLALGERFEAAGFRALRVCLVLVISWAVLRVVRVGGGILSESPWAIDRPSARSLIPLGARVAKVLLLALAAVVILADMGYPVASLLAGLGLGGLAVALAGQKTLENLFGAFAIGVDQPFRQGDFVQVDDTLGTVESVGLRSTRIRTLDRTLVSIPNGKLAEMRVESLTARDRMRLACTVGLLYDTTSSQMREVLSGLEAALREHPKIWPDAVVVRFKELGASSLDIEVMAWFSTEEWSEFQLIRQEMLLRFMDVVERAGTSFAFPTRTVRLVHEAAAASQSRSEVEERIDGKSGIRRSHGVASP